MTDSFPALVRIASYRVPSNHASFAGHFPAYPILPGVVLLDWIAQCVVQELLHVVKDATIHWQNVKFLKEVLPNDLLELRINKLVDQTPTARLQFKCYRVQVPNTQGGAINMDLLDELVTQGQIRFSQEEATR